QPAEGLLQRSGQPPECRSNLVRLRCCTAFFRYHIPANAKNRAAPLIARQGLAGGPRPESATPDVVIVSSSAGITRYGRTVARIWCPGKEIRNGGARAREKQMTWLAGAVSRRCLGVLCRSPKIRHVENRRPRR